MEPLLRHVVEITAHRDHAVLDLSVVSALQELAHPQSIRLLEIITLHDCYFLRPRVWLHNGIIVTNDDDPLKQSLEPLAADLATSLTERHRSAEALSDENRRHRLWLPVWLNDKPVSCFELTSDKPFSSHARSVVEGIVGVYRNFQNLLDYSERDSLTGLFNRKTFDENFSRMVSSSDVNTQLAGIYGDTERRRNQDAKDQWLAVFDIDHFKKVNDQFGHLYGDEVLILIANLLKSSFRSHDRIFRFGGEEFVILLRSVTLQNARMVLERFRQRVANHYFPQVGRVTVSIGFVRISGDSPVVILGRADQALYYAKSNGRNQVCYYDDLVNQGVLHQDYAQNSVEFF